MALLEPYREARTVRLADTDAARVVFFTRPLEWCHATYEAWLDSVGLGLGENLPKDELLLPIVNAQVTHEQRLALGDRLEIELRTERIGNTSYTLAYHISRRSELCVRATTTHVCLALDTGRPQPFPQALRTALENLEVAEAR